jgi:hypothetical protein
MAARKSQQDEPQAVGTADQEPRQQADDGSAVPDPDAALGAGPQEGVDSQADSDLSSVQEAVDVETEQGYRGSVADETPNRNYTVAGQLEGAPTPEAPASE